MRIVMKRYIVILLCAALAFCSCTLDEPKLKQQQLAVNFSNTAGYWSLTGLPEGASVILHLNSTDKTFVLEQNTDSMYPVKYTGTYNLLEYEGFGMVLRGIYDYTWEFWNHEYLVERLTADEMTLKAVDTEEVFVYERLR